MNVNEDLAVGLGGIKLNLLSIEFLLRLFLYDTVGPSDSHLRIESLSVGDVVRETPLTSYDSLGDLIRKVNDDLTSRGLAERIDNSLVDLRDALAHGRISSDRPEGPFALVKFSKPTAGSVQVTVAYELSPEWLTLQTKRTSTEAAKIMRLGRSLCLPGFPQE